MTNKTTNKKLTRRKALTGLATLTATTAGCAGLDPSNLGPKDPNAGTEPTPNGPQYSSWRILNSHKNQFKTFNGGENINRTNNVDAPITNTTIETTQNTVTIEINEIQITREITAELHWTHDNNTQKLGEKTLTPNSPEDQQNYGTKNLEFPNINNQGTYTPVYYSLILKDPHHGHGNGVELINAREVHIPYTAPNGTEKTHTIPIPQATHYPGIRPEVWNNIQNERLENGNKIAYGILNHNQPDEAYGIATEVDQEVENERSGQIRPWYLLGPENADAEDYNHFQQIGQQIKEGCQRIGKWTTLTEKIQGMANAIKGLNYSVTTGSITPTTCLIGNQGIDCTDKTGLFNAILQSDAFGYEEEDASYMVCRLNDIPHLITGINIDNFEPEEIHSDWETYSYENEVFTEQIRYPDNDFVLIDVTSGIIGGHEKLKEIRAVDNLDGDNV